MKERKNPCWPYSIVWCYSLNCNIFPPPELCQWFMQVRYTMINWYYNYHYITINSFNKYSTICLIYVFCIKKSSLVCFLNLAWYQISKMPNGTKSLPLGRSGTLTSVDLKTKGCTAVYCFGRGCKTIKAVFC